MVRGDDTIDSQVSLPYVDRADGVVGRCQSNSTGFGVEHLRYVAGASSSERVPGATIAPSMNQATSRKRYSRTLLGRTLFQPCREGPRIDLTVVLEACENLGCTARPIDLRKPRGPAG
jgi:hypothetical protein